MASGKSLVLAVLAVGVLAPLARAHSSAPTAGGLVICKAATSDAALAGQTFQFRVKAANKLVATVGVQPGSCSTPVQGTTSLPAPASYTVREDLSAGGFTVSAIAASPAAALTKKRLAMGKAVVTVTPGATTTVTFTNASTVTPPALGYLDLCKDGRDGLSGSAVFTVDDHAGHVYSGDDAVVVPVDSCAPVLVTAGTVDVAELGPQPASQLVNVYSVPSTALVAGSTQIDASGQDDVAGSAQVVVTPGSSTLDAVQLHFVDERLLLGSGTIEICKNVVHPFSTVVDHTYDGTVFTFDVAGLSSPIKVAAGRCSFPTRVPLTRDGTTQVTEEQQFGFVPDSVVGSAAGGTCGRDDLRCSVTPGGDPFTYLVKLDPSSSETVVTFDNRPLPAQIKICKRIAPGSEASLSSGTFTFTVLVNGVPTPDSPISVPAGACTLVRLPVNVVIDAQGDLATVTVTEAFGPWAVTSIAVDNTSTGNTQIDLGGQTITFNPGPGVDVVMYTNKAVPPPQAG